MTIAVMKSVSGGAPPVVTDTLSLRRRPRSRIPPTVAVFALRGLPPMRYLLAVWVLAAVCATGGAY